MKISHDVAAALDHIVGSENLITDPSAINDSVKNTLGLSRQVSAIIYPASKNEVHEIVKVANRYAAPLYPVSRGHNMGYGEKIPVRDGQMIVDLSKMDRIRHFDSIHGFAVVEPGVTQKKLFDYLTDSGAPFWMDATGAGLNTSIIGNTLEGGFGHTPKGDRRISVADFEVVLGNGSIVRTGIFPGLGPDISGLFVQSNFGIITSARVELMSAPEYFESFVISVRENPGLELLIDLLRTLRQRETITNLVHIANAVRSLMTTDVFPEEHRKTLITCEMAVEILSSPILKVGYWTAVGGIYGSRDEVRARKKELKKIVDGCFRVRFFNDSRINSLKSLVNNRFIKKWETVRKISKSMDSYEDIHGLMKGIPSDRPLKNIKWRVDENDRMGLIWFSPAVPAQGTEVRKVVTKAEHLYRRHGFELPVTITLVKPDRVVLVLSINFDRENPDEKKRAMRLYDELKSGLENDGISPYRASILGMGDISYHDEGKTDVFRSLKKIFDPNNIISPGRYGI